MVKRNGKIAKKVKRETIFKNLEKYSKYFKESPWTTKIKISPYQNGKNKLKMKTQNHS